MSKKITRTEFKTKKINAFTGGMIRDWEIPDYPKTINDDGILHDSFVAPDGTYLGDYGTGWWYVKNNMVLCFDHPHGVAIVLKNPLSEYKHFEDYKKDGKIADSEIEGYYGYSHRGGCVFKIGDRLFDEKYEPVEKDFNDLEWQQFTEARLSSIKDLVEKHNYKMEDALRQVPLSDVIPFRKRGFEVIENWEQAKQAAMNLSKYLG